MAWCPFAERVALDTSSHARITPEVVVLHSVAGSGRGAVGYFSGGGTSLQSHFVIGEDGHIWQLVDTEVAAYANFDANWYGISIEHGNVRADATQSPGFNADHWGTPEQVAASVKVIAWCCDTHGIPRRKATSARSGGVGYHRQFPQWSGESAGYGSTDCPGDTRVAEFDTVIIPALTGANPSTVEVPEVITDDDITRIAKAVNAGGAANAVIVALGDVLRQRGMADAEVKAHIDQVVGHLAPAQRNVVVRDGRDQSVWVTDGQTKRPAGKDLQLERFFAGQPGDIVPLTAQIATWLDAIPLAGKAA